MLRIMICKTCSCFKIEHLITDGNRVILEYLYKSERENVHVFYLLLEVFL